ncbi:MAG: gliding motility-associated C-terminal domain-containing protein [Flavobacteriales bacterium]
MCGNLQLDAGVANATYEWQDGSTDQTLEVTTSGTYWVRVTQDCCLATDTIEVQVGEFTDLDLGPDTAICAADLLILEPPFFPGDYLWSDGSTDMIFLVFEPGTYWLEITDGGCVSRDTIVVTTLEVPTVDLGADTSSCTGASINLVPLITGADQLLWSDGSDGTELLAQVSGTYWLEAGNYCAFVTDSIEVTIADPIVVDLGPDTLVCAGLNYLLEVDQPGWTVTWSDGSVGSQLFVTTGGQYWVDVVNGQCAYSDTVLVDELDVPTIMMPNDTVVCDGGPFTIVPILTDPDVLLWSDGSDQPELIVTESGEFTLSVTNACGAVTDGVEVTIVSFASDLGPDTLLCVPDSLVLDLSDVSGTLLWSDGSTSAAFTITAPGTYWVEANVQTCIYRDTVVVDYTELAQLDLGPDTVLCEVPAYILDAGEDGDDAVWSDGSTGRYLFVSEAGVYTARIDNYCGTVSDTLRVAFSMPISSLTDVSLCPGKKAELHPVGELLTILWSTGDTTTTIQVGEGEYSYEATDIVGCPHTDEVRVFIDSGSDGQVYIPNAFSPNGDGFNEFFTVSGPERGEFSMVIFDRWGEEIYRTDNPYKGWDGSTSSGPAMNDVHVYVVTYKDRCTAGNTLVTRRGHVTLLR